METPRSKFAESISSAGRCVFDEPLARGRPEGWRDYFIGAIGPAFDGRVVFEIGSWTAEFLQRIAVRFPSSAFVGLDWKFKPTFEAGARIVNEGVNNVALIRGRARLIGEFFRSGEVDEVWLFHPDPCDRPVELPNRLVRERFLLDVAGILKPGGRFCFKTDHPGYLQWVLAILGLPEPPLFALVREASPARPVGKRLRTKDLMPPDQWPARSEAVAACFAVTCTSADYWHDPEAQAATAERLFAGELTAFEQRFAGKRMPIYYVELQRR